MRPREDVHHAIRLAREDPARALPIARRLGDPWHRAQALVWVGRYWPDKKYGAIIDEAVKAIESHDDIHARALWGAWPVRAYLERGNREAARQLLTRYVRLSGQIENMAMRSHALFTLLQAVRPFAADLWQPVFRAVVNAAEPALSWRQGDALGHAVEMVARDHPELVEYALLKLSDERNLTAVRRGLRRADRRPASIRPFFWRDDKDAARIAMHGFGGGAEGA